MCKSVGFGELCVNAELQGNEPRDSLSSSRISSRPNHLLSQGGGYTVEWLRILKDPFRNLSGVGL